MSSNLNPKDIVRQGYDKVSHAYRDDVFDYENSNYKKYLGWLEPQLQDGARVLDIGCGNGIPIAQQLAERFQVIGVDISRVQIERARKLVPQAEFILGDITNTAFPPDYFDAVVAMFSIIHIPTTEQVSLIGAIGAWLKPGGYFLATLGHQAWEGTEDDWRGVSGALMYWSHADGTTYKQWFMESGMHLILDGFHPEGESGFSILFAQKNRFVNSPSSY